MRQWLYQRIARWLTREIAPATRMYSNFDRLCFEVEPADALLVEGRSRVSQVIKTVTHSVWTHSALYVGRLVDIDDPALRAQLERHYAGDPAEQLVIEAQLGDGVIVAPLAKYRNEHLRICRPIGLSRSDTLGVLRAAASQLGKGYDVRQLLDLARFFLPWSLMPRRWRSSLFERTAGEATRNVCSSMMAEAFAAVQFPVRPFIRERADGSRVLYKRNPKLFTPRDFDYSPYFDVVKYPYLDRGDIEAYRQLNWGDEHIIYNDEDEDEFTVPDAQTADGTGDTSRNERDAKTY
ncbi:MAG: hypothetical protein PVI37_00935 [Gammaproteobacteria bacterium]|jgi:hypothetical protein